MAPQPGFEKPIEPVESLPYKTGMAYPWNESGTFTPARANAPSYACICDLNGSSATISGPGGWSPISDIAGIRSMAPHLRVAYSAGIAGYGLSGAGPLWLV